LLRAAYEFAATYDAHLDLLHVIEMPLFVGIYSGLVTANDLVPDVKEQSLARLKNLWAQVDSADVQAVLHIEEGSAAASIVDFAVQRRADLIVIASQGRSGIARFLIGSVAERVVRTAPCPVLTIKTLPAGTAGGQAPVDRRQAVQ
jgi:nucleotide-binding universal stress UspA family protein